MKLPSIRLPRFVHAFAWAVATALIHRAFPAHAATIYWDGTGTGWDSTSNWSTAVGATTLDPGAVPGAADVATFSISSITATAQKVNLNADPFFAWLSFLGSNPCTRALLGGGKLQLCGLSARAAVQIFLVGTHDKGGTQRRRFAGNLFAPPLG